MRLFCILVLFSLVSLPVNSVSWSIINSIVDTKGGFIEWINTSSILGTVKEIFAIATQSDSQGTSSQKIPEDAFLNVTELAEKYGYDFEEHRVITEDGYILALHRINRNCTKSGKIVFLMHGLQDSSDGWILQGPNHSLGYILADEGYDVWLGNARGNKHSSSHINLSTKDPEFWHFTWEEIGLYDLPAMIDYILNFTQKENLYYVGHSQGTTTFFVMLAMKPEYEGKIKMMFALSPVAFMSHVKSPIVRLFSPANKLIASWLSNFNTLSPSSVFFNRLLSIVCFVLPRCDNYWSYIAGAASSYTNSSLLPVIYGHMPSGSSTLQFVHFGQLVQSGNFSRYDFGTEKNLKMYGIENPPNYNLTNVITPIVLFYSENDWLSDPIDVQKLESTLPNVYKAYCIRDYNHLDFLYASTAKEEMYFNILKHIYDMDNTFV